MEDTCSGTHRVVVDAYCFKTWYTCKVW